MTNDDEREADLLACSRMLGDATYQLGIVAGRLDEMGVKTGLRHIVSAYGQIMKARAALARISETKKDRDNG
jgi:hypothetical protein